MQLQATIAAVLAAWLCPELARADLPYVTLVPSFTDVVDIMLTGTEGQWFAIGFGASAMASRPWTLVVDGSGAVSEHKLGTRGPGDVLSASVTVQDSTVSGGQRIIMLRRPMVGPSDDHYTFAVGDINIIRATGTTASIAHHSEKEATSVTLDAPRAGVGPSPTPPPPPPPTPSPPSPSPPTTPAPSPPPSEGTTSSSPSARQHGGAATLATLLFTAVLSSLPDRLP